MERLIATNMMAICAIYFSLSASSLIAEVSPIVGAWQFGDGSSNSSGVLVFKANNVYFHAEDVEAVEGPDGMEAGTYSWNEETGELLVDPSTDTNEEIGLSHPNGGFTVSVDGDELTISDGDGTYFLYRVYDAENPIVGGWAIIEPEDAGFVVFLANGVYFHAEIILPEDAETASTGIERGFYNWAENGVLTATQAVDTNGDYGFSDSSSALVVITDGTTLTYTEDVQVGGETFTLERISNSTAPPAWYSGASQIQPAGWRYFDWFKGFKPEGPNWIYHVRHGWLYVIADDTSGMFLWDVALGRWMYTNATAYPWMYAYGSGGGWVFFFEGGSPGSRYFKRGDNAQVVSEQNLSLNP